MGRSDIGFGRFIVTPEETSSAASRANSLDFEGPMWNLEASDIRKITSRQHFYELVIYLPFQSLSLS